MQHQLNGSTRPTSLDSLPNITLDLSPEEFTLVAYAVYRTLSGICPARTSLETTEVWEAYTGLDANVLGGDEANCDVVLKRVNKALREKA